MLSAISNVCLKKCRTSFRKPWTTPQRTIPWPMVVALSYSSRWELTKAARDIARKVRNNELKIEDITEQTISENLCTHFMPDPELLIRTGGELRISNYMLWQLAYSELYFCNTYWPDFDEADLHKAIIDYQSRQRRFGKTEKQVETEQEKI